ncbi:hypothetical protein ACIGXF_08420 [Streptomyces sp. NPDC053086]|uniref:hypothetical protein n=1 Tax=unclassified Streptomyces TaxID=2593676 RepID=UPI0037D871B9
MARSAEVVTVVPETFFWMALLTLPICWAASVEAGAASVTVMSVPTVGTDRDGTIRPA